MGVRGGGHSCRSLKHKRGGKRKGRQISGQDLSSTTGAEEAINLPSRRRGAKKTRDLP